MKYSIIKHLYKFETPTKVNRRHKLCLRIINNLDYTDLDNLNYLNISKNLKIERKTLYNYFPDRDELLFLIALCLLEDIHAIKYKEFKSVDKDEYLPTEYIVEVLYKTLNSIVFFKKPSLHYLKKIESLLIQPQTTEKSKQLYNEGINYLKCQYGIIESELRLAISNGIISSPIGQSDDDLIFTIIESGYSYQAKLLSNNELSNSQISDYLLQYIRIIIGACTI